MRIVINDFSGHSFTISLSRQLALLGHKVFYAYSSSFQSPKGDFTLQQEDKNLEILSIKNKNNFSKYSLFKRRKQEIEYADFLIQKLEKFNPEVILTGNTPLFVQKKLQFYCLKQETKFVYWCQDIYSIAIEKIARKKIGILGWPLWKFFHNMEKYIIDNSNSIIIITDDFKDIFNKWGLSNKKIHCIPNWAPINQIHVVEKENSWSRKHELTNKFCVFYTGTLGFKHNPDILIQAAIKLKHDNDIFLGIISEGIGADYILKKKSELKLNNIQIFPFQPFKEMPDVFGTADILVSVLEKDAGTFSVPSKILSYLCAAKPIIIAAPANNLASKIIKKSKSGYNIEPEDIDAFVACILSLKNNKIKRVEYSKNARDYAEKNFKIENIADKFLEILTA
ncbi:MAG: glycosyltransferase family 4 protein [Bacteroidetes bacterium]|nr:glycosyltransferase family 4 protein [Bacteroidota bacterium]